MDRIVTESEQTAIDLIASESQWTSRPLGTYWTLRPGRFLSKWNGDTEESAIVRFPYPGTAGQLAQLHSILRFAKLYGVLTGEGNITVVSLYEGERTEAVRKAFRDVAAETGLDPDDFSFRKIVSLTDEPGVELHICAPGKTLEKLRQKLRHLSRLAA